MEELRLSRTGRSPDERVGTLGSQVESEGVRPTMSDECPQADRVFQRRDRCFRPPIDDRLVLAPAGHLGLSSAGQFLTRQRDQAHRLRKVRRVLHRDTGIQHRGKDASQSVGNRCIDRLNAKRRHGLSVANLAGQRAPGLNVEEASAGRGDLCPAGRTPDQVDAHVRSPFGHPGQSSLVDESIVHQHDHARQGWRRDPLGLCDGSARGRGAAGGRAQLDQLF